MIEGVRLQLGVDDAGVIPICKSDDLNRMSQLLCCGLITWPDHMYRQLDLLSKCWIMLLDDGEVRMSVQSAVPSPR
jgi:hypothetical protein